MFKKSHRYRRFVVGGISTAVGLAAVVVPVGHAAAATPTIVVTPTTGVAGASVTLSGSGWSGYDTLRIDLDQGASANYMCEVTANSAGAVASQSCTVPTSVTQGAYTLSASDGTLTATKAFTLNPGISALGFNVQTASTFAAGQTIGLVGSGFAAGSALKATFNGAAVTLTVPETSSTTGGFSGTGIVIPVSTVAGSYPIVVKDSAGHAATIHVQVFAAKLTVTPATGVSGATVSLAGTGFPGTDSLRVELNQGTTQNYVCSAASDSSGAVAQSCTLPTALPQGSYSLVVEDGNLAVTKPLTLNPGISALGFNVQPASSFAAGQTVGLSGTGFAPNLTLKATFNAAAVTLTVPETSSTTGGFSGTGIVIPVSTVAGSYPIVVKDSAGHAATIHVQVFAAKLTVTPATGVSGATVSLAGTGFPGTDSLRVELNQGTTQNYVCSAASDSSGAVAQSCTLPTALPQGSYSLVVEDGNLAVTKPLTLNPGISALGFNVQPASSFAAGQTVGLSGTGFAPNLTLKATFNAAALTLTVPETSSTTGGFSGTGIVIPVSTVAGSYPIVVKDSAGHAATIHVQVFAAKFTVTPTTGVSGLPFDMQGSGFPSNDSLRVELNQGTTQNYVCSVGTDGNGTLSQSCTTPTSLPQGKYSLVVEDNNLAVTEPFTVAPGISLFAPNGQPLAKAAPDAAATLNGSGFAPNSTIVKLTIGTHTVGFSSTPVSGSSGAFSGAAFTVPSLAAGTYTVVVTDAAGNSGTAQLIIT